MKIEILCTGDEILSGKTVNTNYSFMARRLTEHGYTVQRGITVGDDRQALFEAFQQASQHADVVIVNGGLGPTVDDLSQEVAARAAGVKLELYQPWIARIAKWYAARGRKMPDNNTKQAMLPAGAEFIDNPVGTACGFAVTINQCHFFFTPGVPPELQRMFNEQILPRLEKMRGKSITTRIKRFHSFGIGESRADRLLSGIEGLVDGGRVKLGFQSHFPQLETKLTVQGESATELDALLVPLSEEIRKRIGDYILCEDGQTLEGVVLELLGDKSASLSVFELNTGAGVASRLNTPEFGNPQPASGFRSAMLATSLENLKSMLGPDAGIDGTAGTGDAADLVISCAKRVRELAATDYGLALLVMPPAQDTPGEHQAGVWIGISAPDQAEQRHATLNGSENWIRKGASELALDCLRRYLLDQSVYQKIDFEQH